VVRDKATSLDPDSIDFGNSPFKITLELLVESDADEVLLFACGPTRASGLDVIQQLRDQGIAEPA
jgi:hypothetical protein